MSGDLHPPSSPRSAIPLEARYDVLRELGRGGMGEVVLALDPELGRTVAVKILLDEGVANDEVRTRFLREAQLTAQLEHPNILPVYALEHSQRGAPAFSMKVVRGRTFDDLVAECRRASEAGRPLNSELSLDNRLELFLRVCDALAYAHDHGVVHRDLKPENLMLGAFGEVYVVDWGIAKVMGEVEKAPKHLEAIPEGLTTATQAGYAIGTPAYMSPEQAAGEIELVGPASDQYALGLILQELITLTRANDTGDLPSTLARAIKAERAPLVPPRGKVPRDLAAIVARATAMEPEDRYPSVSDFDDDLRRFLHNEETVARPDSLWRKPVRWTLRHPGLATSLGLGLTLVAVFAIGTLVLASVIGLAASQAAAHRREEAMTALVMAVSAQSHALDTRFLGDEALLERLAGSTVQLLEHGTDTPGPFYTPSDLLSGHGPPDYAQSALYGQGITLQAPAIVIAPGIERRAVARDMYRLRPLTTALHAALLGDPNAHPTDAVARAIILGKGAPVAWSYVGLEDGVLLNYPGNTKYSADYDARKRPWYTEARGTHGPIWGAPYPDDSGRGLLLPCDEALYDASGRFLGVASLSVTLTSMVHDLLTDRIPGLQTAYVVDDGGNLVVASDQKNLDLWAGLNHGKAVKKQPFPVGAVREALADKPTGDLQVGDVIYVWARMNAVGWTYVAKVSAGEALAGR